MTDATLRELVRQAVRAELAPLQAGLAELQRTVNSMAAAQLRPGQVWPTDRLEVLFTSVWRTYGTNTWTVRDLHDEGWVAAGETRPLGYALAGLRDRGGQLSVWQLRSLASSTTSKSNAGQLWQLQAAEGDDTPLSPPAARDDDASSNRETLQWPRRP